jgi:hypothetical protein
MEERWAAFPNKRIFTPVSINGISAIYFFNTGAWVALHE